MFDDADFILELVDPCDPPTKVTPGTQTDQEYTITDNALADYTFTEPTVNPDGYCTVTTSYDISKLTGDLSAIEATVGADDTFSFSYASLDAMDQTQTIT